MSTLLFSPSIDSRVPTRRQKERSEALIQEWVQGPCLQGGHCRGEQPACWGADTGCCNPGEVPGRGHQLCSQLCVPLLPRLPSTPSRIADHEAETPSPPPQLLLFPDPLPPPGSSTWAMLHINESKKIRLFVWLIFLCSILKVYLY